MIPFSAANLIGGMIFSSIGFVAYTHGKRLHQWRSMLSGLALMIFPYFAQNTACLFAVGSLATLALYLWRD